MGFSIAVYDTWLRRQMPEAILKVVVESGQAELNSAIVNDGFVTAQVFSDLTFDLTNPEATNWAG
ncbi:unnamed protein product, partial [marine sediment metagenome]